MEYCIWIVAKQNGFDELTAKTRAYNHVFLKIKFFDCTVYAGRFLFIMTQYGSGNLFLLYSRQVGLGRRRVRFLNFCFAKIQNLHILFLLALLS